MPSTLGRNDPCHCGSEKKYKACHLGPDEAKAREVRADAAKAEPTTAPASLPAETAKAVPAAARHSTRQPWKGGMQNTRGFQKVTASRKVGGGG